MPDPGGLDLVAKQLTRELLLVPSGFFLAILVGLVVARRRRRSGLVLVAVASIALVALSLPGVSTWLASFAEADYAPYDESAPTPPNAAIVVLGGGLQTGALDYGGETVNTITLARLRRAARLAKATDLPVLVSGSRSRLSRLSEGELMAGSLAADFGVPVRWVESAARDTAENASFSATILAAAGVDTALLVTDVQHLPRAKPMFEARGLKVVAVPTDFYASQPMSVSTWIPSTLALRRSSLVVHERVGQVWSRVTRSFRG